MLVHRSAHKLVEAGGHFGVSSSLSILCFETRLPTAPGAYQLAGSAGQQSSNFPVSSFQSAITEVNHHAQFFLWGPGFQSLVFIPKKGTISLPSHLSSPHGSFQYFKDVDPLFLPLHCLPQNNKEKSISCERREQSCYCVTTAGHLGRTNTHLLQCCQQCQASTGQSLKRRRVEARVQVFLPDADGVKSFGHTPISGTAGSYGICSIFWENSVFFST